MLTPKRRGMEPDKVVLPLLCLAVSGYEFQTFSKLLTAYSHDVAPKPSFERTFDRVYSRAEEDISSTPVNAQEIALVYIIMAQGTMFNIEMPHYDPSIKHWLHLSERALVKGDFISNNTVAGLQTLVSSQA